MGSFIKHKYAILSRLAFLAAALLVLAGVVLAWPSTAAAQGEPEKPSINSDRVVQKGEVVEGDVNVTNGNLTVYGTIRGNAVVFNGDAAIDGRVGGNLAVLVSGSVRLGPGATVDGDLLANGDVILGPRSTVSGNVSAVGGKVIEDPTARVGGKVSAAGLSLNGVQNQVVITPAPTPIPHQSGTAHERVNGPPTFFDRLLALIAQGILSVVVLGLGALLVALMPARVRVASATLEAEPGPSLIVGFITALLLFPVVALLGGLLAISVIGLPFIPVLAIAVLLVLLFGLVTVSSVLGRWVYQSTHQGMSPSQSSLMLQVLTGMAIVLATALIPSAMRPGFVTGIMMVLLYFLTCTGIGALVLSRLGTLMPPGRARNHFYRSGIPPAPPVPPAPFGDRSRSDLPTTVASSQVPPPGQQGPTAG